MARPGECVSGEWNPFSGGISPQGSMLAKVGTPLVAAFSRVFPGLPPTGRALIGLICSSEAVSSFYGSARPANTSFSETNCNLSDGRAMSQPLELRPGLADVPVAESAVSFIDGKRARLEYRGIPVETLAKDSCFEETAWLLLKGDLPSQRDLANLDDRLRHHRRIKYKLTDLIKCLPESG